jgi:hypothetical protein
MGAELAELRAASVHICHVALQALRNEAGPSIPAIQARCGDIDRVLSCWTHRKRLGLTNLDTLPRYRKSGSPTTNRKALICGFCVKRTPVDPC